MNVFSYALIIEGSMVKDMINLDYTVTICYRGATVQSNKIMNINFGDVKKQETAYCKKQANAAPVLGDNWVKSCF